jgi:hypothetical protein
MSTGVNRRRASCPGGADSGAVAVIAAIVLPVLLILCAISLDVATWYVEVMKVQKAADAAALGGVTSMPDFVAATTKAREVSGWNGYPNSGTTTVVPYKTNHTTELGVLVSSTIHNTFGAIFGQGSITISRAAVADYTGQAIMGSPCNALGNQPPSAAAAAQPTGSVIPPEGTGSGQGGYHTCQDPPGFWMNIAGPATNKQNGDRYATRYCAASDVCSGSTNREYLTPVEDTGAGSNGKNGYFFIVRVRADAVLHPITLQLYDPAFVYTNDTCTAAPPAASLPVTSRSRTTSVVTLTTSLPHGFVVGDSVVVAIGDSKYNGTYPITSTPTATTFEYNKTNSSAESVTSASGTANVAGALSQARNPYTPDATTSAARYAVNSDSNTDAKTYCTGDQKLTGDPAVSGDDYLNTSFALRNRTETDDPMQAEPIVGCTRQYGSLRANAPADSGALVAPNWGQLTGGLTTMPSGTPASGLYNAGLAQLFHQWVDFCTFTPLVKGDYYLQVRTNVARAGNIVNGNAFVTDGVAGGVNQVTNPASLDETGRGHNRFAVRAYIPGTVASGTNAGLSLASQVSVSGWKRMSIYVNASTTTATFNLVQVLPNAAGKSFEFDAFDNGDATCTGGTGSGCKVQISLPPDAVSSVVGTPLTMGRCDGDGPVTGVLPDCKVDVAGNQGRIETITVQIPTNYSCLESSPGGCWYQVAVIYPSNVSDTTTWDATIQGDVVRLVQ